MNRTWNGRTLPGPPGTPVQLPQSINDAPCDETGDADVQGTEPRCTGPDPRNHRAREFDRLDEVFASDVVDHDPGASQGPGVEGVKQFWREFQAAFPDFQEEIDVLTADGDYVTIAYRISGTHQGAYLGIPSTGKHFEILALQVARYQGGKVKDRWGSSDTLGMLAQLGISIPA